MSVGSPVPLGNIPAGASGSAVVGVVMGATVTWDFGTDWSVVSELQYVHYASSFSTPLTNQPYIDKVKVSAPDGTQVVYDVSTTFTGTATGRFSNDYVQVPVLAAYQASKAATIVGGLYVGWLFANSSHATGIGRVGIRPEVVEKDMYFGEKLNGIDYGLQAGARYALNTVLGIEVRGTYGLTSVFAPDFATVDQTVRNLYVHCCLTYRL